MIVFTSICANYVHKARTLAQSVKRHIPGARFFVCLVERNIDPRIPAACFDEIVLAKDAWQGDFDRFLFKHTIVEASTAVKARFFLYLQETYPEESEFFYLDPDCYVYSDLIEARTLLQTKPILLCPHLLWPGNVKMELSAAAHGVYNLGFLAVNHSAEAQRFLRWWAERLSLYCYDDIANGVFTDQKWVDLAPCFFDTHVLKHAGCDFAPWALLGARLKRQNGTITVMGDPLRFIHYSGFGRVAEDLMEDWMGEEGALFAELYAQYAKEHAKNDSDGISHSQWSYAAYRDGSPIRAEVRKRYRESADPIPRGENPFDKSDAYFEARFEMEKRAEQNAQKPAARLIHLLKRAVQVFREKGIKGFLRRVKRRMSI